MSYYLSLFTDKELATYRKTLPKQYAKKSGQKQICDQTNCVIDDLLRVAAVMADKRKKQPKTHQKELIQQYLDNGGIPGRYGENLPDDPRALKEEDLGI